MGTNYYIRFKPCEYCGKSEDEYHIGKSSYGWVFTLHVDPHRNILTLEDIKKMWDQPDAKIYDEYDDKIEKEEMLNIITKRKHPKGLLRHDIDGTHCIGHGDGTYDFVKGEFF